MEDPSGTEAVSLSPAGAPKSKLDTLSKDDLIKFAKKQMAAMQKMKTKCTDLEKEIQTFKKSNASSSSNAVDSSLLQELTERMEALLLEKAECQQRLVLSCKDLERTKQKTKDDLDQLQGQLDSQKEDHQRHIESLQRSIEESNGNHRKEVAQLQDLLTNHYKPKCPDSSRPVEEAQPCLQVQIKTLVAEMETAHISQEHCQVELALALQEVKDLREELTQKTARHEEEMKALEEDCEMERERLLQLHDELTEQLDLKDTYLQDVQEEDEEPIRGSGIARMLELSGCSQGESDVSDVGETPETCRVKVAPEDLQAQNTMLHDELTLLINLKGELEMELERAKENEVHELREQVGDLTTKHEGLLSQLQINEEQLDMFHTERTKEIQQIQDEKKNELERVSLELERKLQSLGNTKDAEVKHLEEEKAKLEVNLKEAIRERQEMVSSLELTIIGFSAERDNLKGDLKEASSALSCAQEERNLLDLKLTALQSELEQTEANLQSRLHSLAEEVEPSCATMMVLKESHEEATKHSAERELGLQNRIEELEREQSMPMKAEDGSGEGALKESLEGFQVRVEDLEKERDMLRSTLAEVVSDAEGLQKDLEEMKYANETMREENQKLYAHISEEATEDINTKRRDLEEQLEEKNCIVTKLCNDIAVLQESAAQATSCEENAASLSAEKIALLEHEAKEKNDKMNRIKAVAVKAKKELDTSKKEVSSLKETVDLLKAERDKVSSSMKDVIHSAESYRNLQMDYDRLTEQLDMERDKVEGAEKRISELTKRLDAAVSQSATVSSEKEDLLAAVVTSRSAVKQLEAHVKEAHKHRETLEAELLAERAMKDQKVKDLLSATTESEELTAELGRLQQLSQQTAQELHQLRKEAQQNSLLGMEMADYERLVKELNIKVSQGERDVAQLKAQIGAHVQSEESFKQQIDTLKSQVEQREEKASKMKQLLVKTKKDLAEAKKQNASSMMLQASLKEQLETNQQHLESSKIEVSELMAERHRLQEQLRCATEQHQRTASSLQQRIVNLQQECEMSKAELVSTTGDFESYKVRVHNVLKQQKNKATLQSDSEPVKLEREQLSSQVEQLWARLTESQQSLQSTAAELQQLQTEHDTLLERHNKMLRETVAKEAELRERLLTLQSENISLRGSPSVQASRRPRLSDLQRRNPDMGHSGPGSIDLQTTAREEGEGMETAETVLPPHPPLPSLEQLLGSPDPKQEPFVWTLEPTKQELSQKLTTAARSMDHMNSLLHETEATNAVLMEQVTLLKSELRRLERNQEREKSASNLEYLKNVLLQFIFLTSGTERRALLPVIHTMLQLSPEEKSRLAAIAQGDQDASGPRGSGWSSYLHSWSGIR
ncbi:hypothetical protein NHX12_007558 [Muraenolepis orangiensis]|uniref:GRIP domain-containing protein n=1 Tax=Muraenolepis orangiensis TaxID=630683 RepID=A0A9Q0DQ49_9TELE|nr:hypothetical protein NHX12_007558 [Muraenolepis orangiensis]